MQVISKISKIQSETFSLVVNTFKEYTREVSKLCNLYLWRYDHVCITEKYNCIVNMSCTYMCHVVKGLIYFGIANI